MGKSALLKYLDADDKCYGVTGMAIGIVVFDSDKYLSEVTIDKEDIDCIQFLPEYYAGSQDVSAKAAWNRSVNRYQLMAGLVLSNVVCRMLVHRGKNLDRSLVDQMKDIIREEGQESCFLDSDETEAFFNKTFNYIWRVFSDNDIHRIAHDFAKELASRHTLSRSDVTELLRDIE